MALDQQKVMAVRASADCFTVRLSENITVIPQKVWLQISRIYGRRLAVFQQFPFVPTYVVPTIIRLSCAIGGLSI